MGSSASAWTGHSTVYKARSRPALRWAPRLRAPAPRPPPAPPHAGQEPRAANATQAAPPPPAPQSSGGRGSHAPQAPTSCCEEQGGVQIVGCQPFPLRGTENKRKAISRGALLGDTAPAQDVPRTDAPPGAPEAETGTDRGCRAGEGRAGISKGSTLWEVWNPQEGRVRGPESGHLGHMQTPGPPSVRLLLLLPQLALGPGGKMRG